MSGFGLSFGGSAGVDFDPIDAFEPDNLPEPGPFLVDHEVLAERDHAAFHATTADCFGERGVYDATFGYNLARLNRDPRHPDAGFRYAREVADDGRNSGEYDGDARASEEYDDRDRNGRDDRTVLRAEFTPTTPYCPQSRSLTVGAFRAWTGLAERHEYDRVKVRVHPMHHEAMGINGELKRRENQERE